MLMICWKVDCNDSKNNISNGLLCDVERNLELKKNIQTHSTNIYSNAFPNFKKNNSKISYDCTMHILKNIDLNRWAQALTHLNNLSQKDKPQSFDA